VIATTLVAGTDLLSWNPQIRSGNASPAQLELRFIVLCVAR